MTHPRSLSTGGQDSKAFPLSLAFRVRLRLPDHHPTPPGTLLPKPWEPRQQGRLGWRGWEALELKLPANPAQLGD